MSERPYELTQTPEGMVARVRLRGSSVLSSPLINRGTAFAPRERHALGLPALHACRKIVHGSGVGLCSSEWSVHASVLASAWARLRMRPKSKG